MEKIIPRRSVIAFILVMFARYFQDSLDRLRRVQLQQVHTYIWVVFVMFYLITCLLCINNENIRTKKRLKEIHSDLLDKSCELQFS